MYRTLVIALVVSLSLSVTSQAIVVSNVFYILGPSLPPIYFVAPYDHGFAVAVFNGSHTDVYLINSSAVKLLYSWSPYNVTPCVPGPEYFPLGYPGLPSLYVMNGSLYAVLASSPLGTPVVVFNGSRPEGMFLLQNATFGVIENLSAIEIIRVVQGVGITIVPIFPVLNTTVMLNGTNVTVPGAVVTGLRLPQGDLIVSHIESYQLPLTNSVDYIYLYLVSAGKVKWQENVTIVTVGEPRIAFANGELFIVGKPSSSGQAEVLEVNVTDGSISREIDLGNVSWAGVFDLGGKPYVAATIGNETVVYKVMNGSLSRVVAVPDGAPPYPWFYYYPYHYVLFFTPTQGGTNVTAVRSTGVASYFLKGQVMEASDGDLLLNGSGNTSLVVLDNHGTPVREVELSGLDLASLIYLFRDGNASYLVSLEKNSTDVVVKVVEVKSNVTSYTQVLPVPPAKPEFTVACYQLMPEEKALIVTLGALIAIAAVLVLRKPRISRRG